MPTQKQIQANRRNAQKSTGPKTPDGKRIASQNSITHGLTANRSVIENENLDEFKTFYTTMHETLAPVGPVETMLTERIVSLSWRLKRAEWTESGVINVLANDRNVVHRVENPGNQLESLAARSISQSIRDALYQNNPGQFNSGVKRLENLINPPQRDSGPQTVLGCVAIEDFRDANILERLLRYQGQIERSLYRAIFELEKTQHIRHRKNAITAKIDSDS